MKKLQINFTPLEPYFFGNDKIFSFGKSEKNNYYIRSEMLPSQSTIFGAVRYLFLPNKNFPDVAEKIAENISAIGEKSFNIESNNIDFGKIKSMSSIFITGNGKKYIIAPFDAPSNADNYSPFVDYGTMNTADGEKLFISKYDSKCGFLKAIVSLDLTETISFDELFSKSVRVGINRNSRNDGFFKRQFVKMKNGYSFSVVVSVDDDYKVTCDKVYMGQGKSVFSVSYKEVENDFCEEIVDALNQSHSGIDLKGKSLVYFASDSFVDSNIYEKALFAATEIRDFKSFTTVKRSVSKSEYLYKLIKAGSVLIIDNIVAEDVSVELSNEVAQVIGFNKFIIKEY